MNIVCTECGSNELYIVQDEPQKIPETQTLDEYIDNLQQPIPAVYKMTTWACKKCGYSRSY